MKLYKPLFSSLVILVQLIFSARAYHEYVQWGIENPELNGLINRIFEEDTLFVFVTTIAFYEMLTRSRPIKIVTRVLLVFIVLGRQFPQYIPIEDVYSGIYNMAFLLFIISLALILIRIVKMRLHNFSFARGTH